MRAGSAERPVPEGINPLYRLAFSQLARLSSKTLAELGADPALTAQDRAWITLANLYARDGWNLFGLRNAFFQMGNSTPATSGYEQRTDYACAP